MEQEIREITLPGGETVLARVHVLDEGEVPEESEEFQFDDVGTRDQLIARARQLNEVISGVGSAVLAAAQEAAPDEVSATFGVELAVKSGKALAAVLAEGEAKAAVSVTLTWRKATVTGPAPVPEPRPQSEGATPPRGTAPTNVPPPLGATGPQGGTAPQGG
ncbi:CU044_2847 family protein [Streptomyces axinellae]|uniref:CU044_2847 family protein n=1 Tax=Streptomyces axinellae TaxID=552788 RepID=A0ABN3PYT4_9ACTN